LSSILLIHTVTFFVVGYILYSVTLAQQSSL